jgi:PPP family 3-phenylpropionic acid transporter
LTAVARAPPRRSLIAFGGVSFAYFAYAGLFSAYAPLWFGHLGYSTFAIGVLAAVQSATRVLSPYAWGWVADHTGERIRLLRLAIGLSLFCACGYLVTPDYAWVLAVTAALFLCTAGVVPISEAALAHLVSPGERLDAGRYGRVRVWGSVGFILAVSASGFVLQALGVGRFPGLVIALLALLLAAAQRLPAITEPPHPQTDAAGALVLLKQPAVAWFFAGVFFTVLAHTALYAFLSLYLATLGYGRGAIGLIWAAGVAIEVLWFWFQGRWLPRLSLQGWLLLAALLSVLRFALLAACAGVWWILLIAQGLHAFTFAAQHTACIAVINRHFPGRLRGRGQALYTVLGYGASGVLGGIVGGTISQAYGFPAVYWAASGVALVAAACCWRARLHEGRLDALGRPAHGRDGRAGVRAVEP